MPNFAVVLKDSAGAQPEATVVVSLNKVPKPGSWFDVGDGAPAQAKEIRRISGDIVIFAIRGTAGDRRRLKE